MPNFLFDSDFLVPLMQVMQRASNWTPSGDPYETGPKITNKVIYNLVKKTEVGNDPMIERRIHEAKSILRKHGVIACHAGSWSITQMGNALTVDGLAKKLGALEEEVQKPAPTPATKPSSVEATRSKATTTQPLENAVVLLQKVEVIVNLRSQGLITDSNCLTAIKNLFPARTHPDTFISMGNA